MIVGHSMNIVQYLLCILLQHISTADEAPTCVHVLGCAVRSLELAIGNALLN